MRDTMHYANVLKCVCMQAQMGQYHCLCVCVCTHVFICCAASLHLWYLYIKVCGMSTLRCAKCVILCVHYVCTNSVLLGIVFTVRTENSITLACLVMTSRYRTPLEVIARVSRFWEFVLKSKSPFFVRSEI